MKYQTIVKLKESEKTTVELAAVDLFVGPVIVKRLRGGKGEVYRLLFAENNSHIPRIYGIDEQEEELLVVEEYIDGESLEEILRKDFLSDEQKLNYALQLCEAVDFLHAMEPSVIHKDIKLSNILINKKGELKLIDFDASRVYKNEPINGDTRLLGTVGYAPPEQYGYAQTDVRSDIYSMGVVFNKMGPLVDKRLSILWVRIIEKCTSFDPENRYQNVQELMGEIRKLQKYIKNRWNKVAVVCGIVVTVLVLTLLPSFVAKDRPDKEEGGAIVSLLQTPVPTEEGLLTTTTAVPPSPTLSLMPVSSSSPALTESVEFPEVIDYYYYKSVAAYTEVIILRDTDENRSVTNWSGTCYDYSAGITYTIPKKMIEVGSCYIRISNFFLYGLENSTYQLVITTYDESGEQIQNTVQTMKIYDESVIPETEASPLLIYEEQGEFHLDEPRDFIAVVKSSSTARITQVSDAGATGRFDRYYSVLCNGKVVRIAKEYFQEFFEQGKVLRLYWRFDDATKQFFEIKPSGKAISILTPSPTVTPIPKPSSTVTITPTPEVGIIPTSINQKYYKSVAEDVELIINHGSGSGLRSWEAECFDYATGNIYYIPQEAIEIGDVHVRFLDDGLLQLPPSVYNLTLYLYYDDGRCRTTNRVVKVYKETEYPPDDDTPMASQSEGFYSSDSSYFTRFVASHCTSRISDVWVAVDGVVELTRLPSEGYNILYDGKLILISKQYLKQYFTAGKEINLIVEFDDGKVQTVVIN